MHKPHIHTRVLICTHMIACALAHREIMYHLGLHIHPSIAPWAQRPAIDVQCRPHHRSPRAVNLSLSVESENFLTTPLLDVIQPLSAWSSSSQFSFHHSKHHLLHQSVILHPAYMYVSKQIQFSVHDLLYDDVLFALYSSAHFFIRDLLRNHEPVKSIINNQFQNLPCMFETVHDPFYNALAIYLGE